MPYRKVTFSNNEFYHVFNRGTDKRKIFIDKRDYTRFLFLVIYSQAQYNFSNMSRQVSYYVQHQVFNISDGIVQKKIIPNRDISLTAFCFMPNHFHLLLRQEREAGISKYMQKIQNSLAKYFNIKYNRDGHLFSGPFKAVHVNTNEQLLHLSAYIHKNPQELDDVKKDLKTYPWSSYCDFVDKNRWGKLLNQEAIMDQFSTKEEYLDFIKTSSAKEKEYT